MRASAGRSQGQLDLCLHSHCILCCGFGASALTPPQRLYEISRLLELPLCASPPFKQDFTAKQNLDPEQRNVAIALGLVSDAAESADAKPDETDDGPGPSSRAWTSAEMTTVAYRVKMHYSEGDLLHEKVEVEGKDKNGKALPAKNFYYRLDHIGEDKVRLTELKFGEEVGACTRPPSDFIAKKFKKVKKVQSKQMVGDPSELLLFLAFPNTFVIGSKADRNVLMDCFIAIHFTSWRFPAVRECSLASRQRELSQV